MQLHIKDEAVRRGGTPALNHSQIRNRIKRRIYLDHFEMLCVPTKSLMRRQLFRVPVPDKTRIGPTGGADKNFPRRATAANLLRTRERGDARKIGCGGDPAMAGRELHNFLSPVFW